MNSERLDDFLKDGLRILRPGGLRVHAIDMYLQDKPTPDVVDRYRRYANWFAHLELEPVDEIFDGDISFSADMGSNPDDTMFAWGKISPVLIALRQVAQSVSLPAVGRKR